MLKMTDEQRYSAVLKELGEVLQDKNTTISCQRWQIDELKAKLEAAEKERDDARNDYDITAELLAAEQEEVDHMRALLENAKKERAAIGETELRRTSEEMYLLLDNEAIDALRAINAELRKIYQRDTLMYNSELESLQDKIKRILPVNGGAA